MSNSSEAQGKHAPSPAGGALPKEPATAFAVFGAYVLSNWLLTSKVFPIGTDVAPLCRDIATLIEAAGFLAIALVASRAPRLLGARPFLIAPLALSLVGGIGLWAFAPASPLAATLALCLLLLGSVFVMLSAGCCLACLTRSQMAKCVLLGLFASYILRFPLSALGPQAALVLFVALQILAVLVGRAASWVARSARQRPLSSLRGRAANVRKSLLLVDGYNVIRSQGPYRGLVDDDLRDPVLHDVYVRARAALIADVAAFAQGSYTRTTVVFDGFGNPDPERPPRRSAGIDIVFSPSGVEADAVIEQLARTYRVQGWEVTVITSDAGVQSTVFADGVTRLSSRMFTNEAHDMNERIDEMRYVPNTGAPARTTVKDRLPSDVRARLMQMAMTRQSKGASHGRK